MKLNHIKDKVDSIIINIGVLLIYIALAVILIFVGVKCNCSVNVTEEKDLGLFIWNSMLGGVSIATAVIDGLVTMSVIKANPQNAKWRPILIACITYIIVVFDDVAMKYPFPQSSIVVVNFITIILFLVLCSFKNTHLLPHLSTSEHNPKIQRVLQKISNKKIVAIQIYTVYKKELQDKIVFDIIPNESFVRDGYDINGILHMTYEIEKEIVESFYVILKVYQEFVNSGEDKIKEHLICSIEKEISRLSENLRDIKSVDDVTKSHCCLARMLVLYLSFRHILSPDSGINANSSDYIGEVSLCDGDLQLDNDIEIKLFTMIRTGLLGAILLGNEWRHIFKYKKHGVKQGRQYCASQLYSDNINERDFVKICLFTIEENQYNIVPSYIIKSIRSVETQIQKVLHKIYNGGDDDVQN